ncbi:MAG: hypothetical protein DIJKHBIC_02317 [Thermoanaerobaculia bacterium]|nr:hypothetical protein [Thermoanaerobaculia bacterium]
MMSFDSVLELSFQTRQSRDWFRAREFYCAKDRFLHEMLKRQEKGTPFGVYRSPDGSDVPCVLTPEDLRQHALILGTTGSGKSSLLEAIARARLANAQAFCLIDPHGDLARRVATWALATRNLKVIDLDFTRPETLPSWNPLAKMDGVEPGRQVDLLLSVLKKLYTNERATSWAFGVKVSEILTASLRAAIESEVPVTLLDLERFLLDRDFRLSVLQTAGAQAQTYFTERFGAAEQMYASAVINKLSPLTGSESVQKFLGKGVADLDVLSVMDQPVAVIVNLARGALGAASDVLGRLLLNSLLLGALRREQQVPETRRPFSILLDEAHSFAAEDGGLPDLLVTGRKYKVSLALASQGLSLFPAKLRPLLTGNTARQFLFRLPLQEARLLGPDILEPLGTMPRQRVRHYDEITDPLLTPAEEIASRIREITDLPRGACYWAIRGRTFRARRIRLDRPQKMPKTRMEPVPTGLVIDDYSS